MSKDIFLSKLKTQPKEISFKNTIEVIEANYKFTATAFKNGETYNEAGQNNGSCKIFAFAKLHQLSVEQTLHCFGDYYRQDVLKHPEAKDHGNIRNFIKFGWKGIDFKGDALKVK